MQNFIQQQYDRLAKEAANLIGKIDKAGLEGEISMLRKVAFAAGERELAVKLAELYIAVVDTEV